MLSESDFIIPDWPAPSNVLALQTTRAGGNSKGPYHGLNLGDHVGDDPLVVAANRQLLTDFVPTEPVWMRQVHGIKVIDAAMASCLPEADAAFARVPDTVCCVMTADCLPILLCNVEGSAVAAVHAGWRGLQQGVIEAAVTSMPAAAPNLMAWLGPAIGSQAFEVGDDVRDSFIKADRTSTQAFTARENGKWLADIYLLARLRLQAMGVERIYGGDFCTSTNEQRFYSYRRDRVTGRMATMIWIAKK